MNGNNRHGGALSGYRILDLTDEKGMLCSRLLADMGAEVIRIEKPVAGRTHFRWENLGKRSITLDIETQPGQEIFRKLAKTADAAVESHQPGYLDALGLSYNELSEINPRLIMASITDFGQSGPHRDYKSSDLIASALSGQMSVCGEPGKPPLKLFGSQTYYTASIFAAIGIMLSLWNRHATGRGQHIDISLQECATATLDHVLVRYFYEKVVAKRRGSRYWNDAFRIFPCCDGYILLTIFQQWETLVEWLESECMADDLTDARWLDRAERVKSLDHILEVLERWTKKHTVNELVEKGQLMRFPWAKVTSIPELLESPQLKERGFWVEIEHPETGRKYKIPGIPCQLSSLAWQAGSHLPKPDQDNIRVYRELGLNEDEIESLARQGII